MLRRIESALTDLAAGLVPWLAPIPSAYLVGRASIEYLAWPVPVAIVAAVIVEGLGLSSVATALELREYNATRRKTDPAAPFWLAAALAGAYLLTAITLVVLLDLVPSLAHVAPAIWPVLSLVGAVTLAVRADHRRRLASLATEAAERKAERKANRQGERQAAPPADRQIPSNNPITDTSLDKLQAGKKAAQAARLDTLLDLYLDNPDLTPSEAARRLGVSRQTIYTYLGELETAGRIHRNGRTEVL
ncbi:MAG: winged helix-turn-helix transcriptional regulator [Chloroflexota bacterium]